jgi:hypothetical protein
MSDEIICSIEGCTVEGEVEVERQSISLWLCGEHYHIFFGKKQIPNNTPECECKVYEALQGCVRIMEAQESRANGEFHWSHDAFYPLWREAIDKAKALLKSYLNNPPQ